MNRIRQPLDDDDFDRDGINDSSRIEALWVHGLLKGLAEPVMARTARVEQFVSRLGQDGECRNRAALVWRSKQRTLVGLGVAASVVVGWVLFGLQSGPARAGVDTLVRKAQQALELSVDRCYLVQWEDQPGADSHSHPEQTRLWTRGDRFWVAATGARPIAYGSDEQGRLWAARTPRLGVRFDNGEADIPPELALTASIFSMRLDTLLDEVLRDFDLQREWPHGLVGQATQTIRADLKPGREHPSVKSAVLEIDNQTHAVRRLMLWRRQAIVTYTLIETAVLDDEQYTLEGHLEPDASIYTHSKNPELRRQKLRGD